MDELLDAHYTGVYTRDAWSLKAWWSPSQHHFYVQVEHDLSERGGWIRAWLMASPDHLARYATLEAAHAAIREFLNQPDWSRCQELSGVI